MIIQSTDKNKAFSNEDFVGKTLLFLFSLLNCSFIFYTLQYYNLRKGYFPSYVDLHTRDNNCSLDAYVGRVLQNTKLSHTRLGIRSWPKPYIQQSYSWHGFLVINVQPIIAIYDYIIKIVSIQCKKILKKY